MLIDMAFVIVIIGVGIIALIEYIKIGEEQNKPSSKDVFKGE